MVGAYIPAQTLVFLKTDTAGLVNLSGLSVTPYAVFATYVEDPGCVFEDKQAAGLPIRRNDQLTEKVLRDSHASNRAQLRNRGLLARPQGLVIIPIYEQIETGELGAVFWSPQSQLVKLDDLGLNYEILRRLEERHARAYIPDREETLRNMRNRIESWGGRPIKA